MATRLSILTTCHSKTPFLAAMLDSFLNSGYHFRNTEILIRDNASPPGGDGDTAREYARRYPDIVRVIRNDVNCRIHMASHQGYMEARGTYVLTFGYDDIFVPFDLDAEMDFLDAHPEYCATCGYKRLFNVKGDMQQAHGGDSSLFAMTLDPRETDCGMIIRTSDLLEAGGCFPACVPEPPENMPDVITHIGLCVKKPFAYRHQVRGFYRRHEQQHTANSHDVYANGYSRLRDAMAKYYAPLYNGLRERKPMQIAPEDIRPAVILLGSMMARQDIPVDELLQYCAAAEMLAPDDYGIKEYRIKLLMMTQNFNAVLAEAMTMLAGYGNSPYVSQLAFNMAADAAEKLGLPSAATLRRCGHTELRKIFYLSPEQQELLKRTVADFQAVARK